MSPAKQPFLRNRNSAKFMCAIRTLRNRGCSVREIAENENCCFGYVQSMLILLDRGTLELIADVEEGHIPHTIAIEIARAKNPELQRILAEGFKAGIVHFAQVAAIRRRIDDHEWQHSNRKVKSDAASIIRMFASATDTQKLLIRKAKLAQSSLSFIVEAFKKLSSDERFIALLHAQGIHTMPSWLAERVK